MGYDETNEEYIIEFPKKGKQVFTETAEYYEFAHFGWGIKSQFYGYISGYKGVADIAVDFAVRSRDIRTIRHVCLSNNV
ncbi:hypothetical protein [Paenibacillus naphthalenovorans]|uniref:hypothetical protein n=1 Tax=Paenibacillus naphthalenovorans TaxID=162209 RepID=UPI0011137416|nr:hypothetical protein [Paenibacillus naphthalenovorans]